MAAPVKKSQILPHRKSDTSRNSENSNPNLRNSTPGLKSTPLYLNSSKKRLKSLKSLISPCTVQQNKFIVKKKLSIKESKPSNSNPIRARLSSPMVIHRQIRDSEIRNSKIRNSEMRDLRSRLREAPEPGQGRVKYLVKQFEKLGLKKEEERIEGQKRELRFVLSQIDNLQNNKANEIENLQNNKANEIENLQNDKANEIENLQNNEANKIEKSEIDSGEQRESISKRESSISTGSNRTKRNSTESTGRNFTKKPKVTNPHPFTLKTEERGRAKEENFLQKLKKKLLEEERLRVPLAQGLPLTTDEPHFPLKPRTKEPTEPIDLVLHTDIRAVERAEFDQQVAEKISFIEKIKLERERTLKMEKELEIKRLRQELVPKAQPMPCFDKPFIPRRSIIPRTVPKEPRFHARPPRHEKSLSS